MSMTCTCCHHLDRAAIDAALVGHVASIRRIAAQHGVSATALRRHRAHLSATLRQSAEAHEVARGVSLRERMESLYQRTDRLLAQAEQAADLRIAASLVAQVRANVDLMARLTGELTSGPMVHQQTTTTVAIADIGKRERDDRAWLTNELRQMRERVEQARQYQVPPPPPPPVPRATDADQGDGHGNGNGGGRLTYKLT